MSVKSLAARIFAPERLIKPDIVRGPLPSAREAYPTFLKIALPSVAELMLISLISMADTVMVSDLGTGAITAVGITTQPMMLLLCLFFALNIGVTAVVARRKGEERPEAANTALRMSLIMAVLFGLILTAAAVVFAEPLMVFAGAKEEVMEDATIYFRIVSAVLMPRAVTLAVSAAQRGTGNTRISMRINLTANIVNVCFNFLLIGGHLGFPALGVAGAAIATGIGNLVGCVMAILSLTGKRHANNYLFLARGQSWKPDREALKAIFKVSGNAMLEQAVLRFGFFTYARVVASLSVDEFAAHQVCMQMLNLTFTLGDGLGVGATSLVGQNMGRKRPDISLVYGKIAQRIAFCGALILGICFAVFRRQIAGWFGNDPVVIELCAPIFLIAAVVVPIQTSQVVYAGSLRGAGDTRYVAATMLVTVGMLRPGLCWLFVSGFHWGLVGAWLALLIDISLRMTLLSIRFSRGKWFTIKV